MDECEKAKAKEKRTRIRRARAALRKLEKARFELEALGELTDWEAEFISSVTERLDKYDAAFANPDLGGWLEALSGRQKQVLAQMRRKIRDAKRDKAKQAPVMRKLTNLAATKDESPSNLPAPPLSPRRDTTAQKPAFKIIDGGKT